MHDFDEKLREGEGFERVLDRYFSTEYTVTPVSDLMQRQGHDRMFRPFTGGDSFGVEYKADSKAARTNNAFIETQSVEGRTYGWALTAKAHTLVYYIPPRCIAYWVPFARLRAALPEWRERYPVKAAENATYNTLGVIPPLWELARVATKTLVIPPDGDRDSDAAGQLETRRDGTWASPLWARGFGGPLSWSALCARLEIAQRLAPGLQWRIRQERVHAA